MPESDRLDPVDHDHWTAVDRYLANKLSLSDPILERALRACREHDLPEIQVSPNHGRWLHVLAGALQARTILEIGTLGGYSAIWLARALPASGKLITLELDPRHASIAVDNLAFAGLEDQARVIVGPALQTLPEVAQSGVDPFDLTFIDADKSNADHYFDWALRLSRPGSVIVVDNVIRGGGVIDEASEDSNIQGIRRLFDRLANEPRVISSALQTVGVKGHDGLSMALVVSD